MIRHRPTKRWICIPTWLALCLVANAAVAFPDEKPSAVVGKEPVAAPRDRLVAAVKERNEHFARLKAAVEQGDEQAEMRELAECQRLESELISITREHFPEEPPLLSRWYALFAETTEVLADRHLHGLRLEESIRQRKRLVQHLKSTGAQNETVVLQDQTLKVTERMVRLPPEVQRATLKCYEDVDALPADIPDGDEERRLYAVRADELARRCVELWDGHPLTAGVLQQVGLAESLLGDHDSAIGHLESSLRIREGAYGRRSSVTAASLHWLGVVRHQRGESGPGAKLLDEAFNIRKATLGPHHLYTVRSLEAAGEAHAATGAYREARTRYEQALALGREHFGDDHDLTIDLMGSLGRLALATNDVDAAVKLLVAVHDHYESQPNADPVEFAIAENDLGSLCITIDKLAQAKPFLESALRRVEGTARREMNVRGGLLGNLAILHTKMGRRDEALLYQQRALDLRRRNLGERHPDTLFSLRERGQLLVHMGRLEDAERDIRAALDGYDAALGRKHPEAIRTRATMASLLLHAEQFEQAKAVAEEGWELAREVLGEKHRISLQLLALLAQIHEWLDEVDDPTLTVDLYSKAINLALQIHDLRTFTRLSESLGYFYARRGRFEDAAVCYDESQQRLRAYAARNLAGLSEAEQLALLAEHRRYSANALSLGLVSDDENIVNRTCEWVLNGKGLVGEVVALRSARSKNGSQQAARLQSARAEYAHLVARGAAADADARDRRLAELSELIERISTMSGFGDAYAALGDQWITLDRVRRHLPSDAVLVEFARFEFLDWSSDDYAKRTDHYVAWVVPPATSQQGIRVVDLGPADMIDESIGNWRLVISQGGMGIGRGDRRFRTKSATSDEHAHFTLRRLLLEPLLPHLEQYAQWVLSPDGTLWLLPFAALPLEDDTYVIERHVVSYVGSGRELAIPSIRRPLPHQSLVLADPDYDLGGIPNATRTIEGIAQRGVDLREGEAIPRNWARLPGTADEAQALEPRLRGWLGESLDVRVGELAREPVVKQRQRPRVLVLSTHGFFLPDHASMEDSTDAPAMRAPVFDDHSPRRAPPNPLLRCGIVLAGANRSDGDSAEDGILTGLEIVDLDLRGTQLVVLSACETGLGDVRNGDGVAGLRQAFRLAGAENVLATLWTIPDEDTARLMSAFWTSLAEGQTPSAALRAAQLAIVRQSREQGKPAAPYTWAAFTTTGHPRFPPPKLADDEIAELQQQLAVGIRLIDEGKPEDAVATFDAMLLRHPISGNTFGQRGRALMRMNRLIEALCDTNEAVRQRPDELVWRLNRCDLYRRLGRPELALPDANYVVERQPRNPRALAERGTAYSLLKRYDESFADLDAAVQLAPKYPFAWNGRGIVQRLRGNLEAALADHDKAIELAPNWSYAYESRALVHEAMGNAQRATADRARSAEVSP